MRSILLVFLLGCQTPEECPDPVCASCSEVAIDYNDIELEDCETRLGQCVDMKSMVDSELKVCKAKKTAKKTAKTKKGKR